MVDRPTRSRGAGISTIHPGMTPRVRSTPSLPESQMGGKFKLYEPAFDTVRDLIALAQAHGLEIIFIATPNHAYVDYYIDAVGAWDVVEEWLVRLSAQATVYSFPNPMPGS